MINWFPGHMAKTRRLMADNMKLVDVVIELVDARLPMSSRNPVIDELVGIKPRVLALTKKDLAEETLTRAWLEYFKNKGVETLAMNLVRSDNAAKNDLVEKVRKQAAQVLQRRARRGIINQMIRTMVVGIPNSGKSTLINFMAGKSAAETGDRPGVTRGKQWIRLDNDLELLDMPGILWPKIEDPMVGYKLASTGAIGENAYNFQELTLWLIQWLTANVPGRIAARYKVDEIGDAEELITKISRKRGFLRHGGEIDLEKGSMILLDEFRGGKLGRITMDRELPITDNR